MPKKLVFLVHGMGQYEAGWEDKARAELLKAYDAYPTLKAFKYAEGVEFRPIRYDDVFETWRKQWRDDASQLTAQLALANMAPTVIEQLLNLSESATGNSFWQTHVLDVVMFRYITPIAETVCSLVQQQILSNLKQAGYPPYSIIAHSLGTAVVYETLHAMCTDKVRQVELAPAFNLDNLFMVANVAAVLWNKGGEVYNLDMAPAVNGTGSCLRLFNFHHELDPFCAVVPFDPPDSWRGVGEPPQQAFQDVPVDKADIQDVNVHSLTHYLSHPAVHVPILRRLAGSSSVVTDAERDAAITRWRADRIKNKAKLDTWKQRYATWQAARSANWLDELNMLVDWRRQILPFVNRDGES